MDSDLVQKVTSKKQFLYKAQVINYLAVSGMLVGVIINFDQAKVQTTRLEHPGYKVSSKIPSCISCSS